MYIRLRKNLPWMLALMLAFTVLPYRSLSDPGSVEVFVSPSGIADLAMVPGSTFSINVSTSGVERLAGYTIVLSYNKTVLTATNYTSYAPFTLQYQKILNDTGGWIYALFIIPPPTYGVNGTVPLGKIDFLVDAYGVSALDLHDIKLGNNEGVAIVPTAVVDGSFTNVLVHNIAVTSVVASPVRVDPGGLVSINATVSNTGDFDGEVFNVSISAGSIFIGEETFVSLDSGENRTLSFTWNTTGVASNEYIVVAKALVAMDHYPADNTYSIKVRVGVKRDLAVTNVTASQREAAVGQSIIVVVTVVNEGDFSETFPVVARYDDTEIGRTDGILAEHSFGIYTFNWHTEGVAVGEYTLSGEAVVAVDDNPANNIHEGDSVKVGATTVIPTFLLYAIVAIVIVAVVVLMVRRVRRPKPS